MINDRNVRFEFQERSEVFFLMTDECDKKHDILVGMSYEDDQQCIKIAEDQEHILAEAHYEERSDSREKGTLFLLDQREVNFHFFQDPVASLLQLAVKVIIVVANNEGYHGQLCFWVPNCKYLLLSRESDWVNQSRRHFLGWLHWHFDIT